MCGLVRLGEVLGVGRERDLEQLGMWDCCTETALTVGGGLAGQPRVAGRAPG